MPKKINLGRRPGTTSVRYKVITYLKAQDQRPVHLDELASAIERDRSNISAWLSNRTPFGGMALQSAGIIRRVGPGTYQYVTDDAPSLAAT